MLMPRLGAKARQHLVQGTGADAVVALAGSQHHFTTERLQTEQQQAEGMGTQDTSRENHAGLLGIETHLCRWVIPEGQARSKKTIAPVKKKFQAGTTVTQ